MAEERTLKEYANPSTEEPQTIIVYLTIEGDKFEIKPAFLNLVQKNQFSGSPMRTQIFIFPHSIG